MTEEFQRLVVGGTSRDKDSWIGLSGRAGTYSQLSGLWVGLVAEYLDLSQLDRRICRNMNEGSLLSVLISVDL